MPLLHGEVVREELQGHDVHEGRERLDRPRGAEGPVEQVRVHGRAVLDDPELAAADRVDRSDGLRGPLGGRPRVRDVDDELLAADPREGAVEELLELVRVDGDVAGLDDFQRAFPGRDDVRSGAEQDDAPQGREVLRERDEPALPPEQRRDPLRGCAKVPPHGVRRSAPPRGPRGLHRDPPEDCEGRRVADRVRGGHLLVARLEHDGRGPHGLAAPLARDRHGRGLARLRELDDAGGVPLPPAVAHDDDRVPLRELAADRELERAREAEVRLVAHCVL